MKNKPIDVNLLRSKNAIINLKGREYCTYKGLLWVAHEHGLEELTVELISYDPESNMAICRATAKGSRCICSDIGDASPKNVGRAMVEAVIRMASTRAKARALRDYTGIGITCFEELPGEMTGSSSSPKPTAFQAVSDERYKKFAQKIGGSVRLVNLCSSKGWPGPSDWTEKQLLNFIGLYDRGELVIDV